MQKLLNDFLFEEIWDWIYSLNLLDKKKGIIINTDMLQTKNTFHVQ